MATESGIQHDDYLQQLSCRGLTTSSISLREFIFQTFSVIDFILPTIKSINKNVYVQSISERILLNLGYSTCFTCDFHKEWGEKLAARNVLNIFSNNEQNHTNR